MGTCQSLCAATSTAEEEASAPGSSMVSGGTGVPAVALGREGRGANPSTIEVRTQRGLSCSGEEFLRVGNFVLLAEIGSGAQATVHVCVKLDDFEKHEHHASQCQLFAAKVVKKKSLLRRHRKKKNVLDGKEDTGKKGTYGLATGQIAREIAVLKRMRHNNIVKIKVKNLEVQTSKVPYFSFLFRSTLGIVRVLVLTKLPNKRMFLFNSFVGRRTTSGLNQ